MVARQKVDLSVIITTHREGRLIHATLRSIAAAVTHTVHQKYTVETLIIQDDPDIVTTEYIETTGSKLFDGVCDLNILKVSYKNLGLSRNGAIQKAKGHYIATVDGDDLISEQYLTNCLQTIVSEKAKHPVVVHPKYVMMFEAENGLYIQPNQTDISIASVIEYNPWVSCMFASSELLKEFPYTELRSENGFGNEDWDWNARIIAGGGVHIVAPRAAYFYRRKYTGSMEVQGRRLLQPKNPLYGYAGYTKFIEGSVADSEEVLDFPGEENKDTNYRRRAGEIVRRRGGIIKQSLTDMSWAFRIGEPHSIETSLATEDEQYKSIPEWLQEAWRSLHTYEHELFPTKHRRQTLDIHDPRPTEYAKQYWRLIGQMSERVDYLIVVPWLREGGADLVVLNYIRAILENDPNAQIVILATETTNSPWKNRLPKGVTFIQLDSKFHTLEPERQERLLATSIIQTAPHTIQLVNSQLGYRTMQKYSRQIVNASRIYLSAFSVDVTPEGERISALYHFLPDFVDDVTKIFTDNSAVTDDLVERFAISREKFSIHYMPVQYDPDDTKTRLRAHILSNQNTKILWAGRLDYEKHPEILLAIADKCEQRGMPVEFHVWGSAVLGSETPHFDTHRNVIYEGPFSKGIQQLPCDLFDAFLMTSEYEGMPNSLLEATVCGLPVVTSLVGGIKDLINKSTGFGVCDFRDIDSYVTMIEQIINNPTLAKRRQNEAKRIIDTLYTWTHFVSVVTSETNYLR